MESPGMNSSRTGFSLMVVDGQSLQEQQERELQIEEEERQAELKNLLTDAFDDLIEDTVSELSMDEPVTRRPQRCGGGEDLGVKRGRRTASLGSDGSDEEEHTSDQSPPSSHLTPRNEAEPIPFDEPIGDADGDTYPDTSPNSMPGCMPGYNAYSGNQDNGYHPEAGSHRKMQDSAMTGGQQGEFHHMGLNPSGYPLAYSSPQAGYQPSHSHQQYHAHHPGDNAGGYQQIVNGFPHDNGPQQDNNFHDGNGIYYQMGNGPQTNGYFQGQGQEPDYSPRPGAGFYAGESGPLPYGSGAVSTDMQLMTNGVVEETAVGVSSNHHEPIRGREIIQEPMKGWDTKEGRTNMPSALSPQAADMEQLQGEFFGKGGSSGHLEVLCRAKASQLQELTERYELLQSESAKDVRVLKHELALVRGEKAGVEGSLKQTNKALEEFRGRNYELQGQVEELGKRCQTAEEKGEEAENSCQSAEATIESLNEQIVSLGSSDGVSRARWHHEGAVESLRAAHEKEMFTLSEKIDALTQQLRAQKDESEGLRRELEEGVRKRENLQVERAETVEKLTRALAESQRRAQELASAGCGEQHGRLELALKQALSSKELTESRCESLRVQLEDAEELARMYESATTLGVLQQTNSKAPLPSCSFSPSNDTAASGSCDTGPGTVRKKLDWTAGEEEDRELTDPSTAGGNAQGDRMTSRSHENARDSPTTLVVSLKSELQKMITGNTAKRKEINELRETLSNVTDELEKVRTLLKSEREQADSLKQVVASPSAVSQTEAEEMREMIKALTVRVEELASSEEAMRALNSDLQSQLSSMVHESDDDRRAAVDRCQTALLEHHERAKSALEEELTEKFEGEKLELDAFYRECIAKLRESVKKSESEADEVKNQYVLVCQEKGALDEQLIQLKEECDKEKAVECERLRKELSSDGGSKDDGTTGTESSLQAKVEEAVSAARNQWESASHQAASEAASEAVKSRDKACELVAEEWQQKMAAHRKKWERDIQEEMDAGFQGKIAAAKKVWGLEHATQSEKQLGERMTEEKARQTEAIQKLEKKHAAVNSQLTETVRTLREENERLAREKGKARAQWSVEKKRLVEEGEKLYRDYLQDQRGMLATALKGARDQCAVEKEALRREIEQLQADVRCERRRRDEQWEKRLAEIKTRSSDDTAVHGREAEILHEKLRVTEEMHAKEQTDLRCKLEAGEKRCVELTEGQRVAETLLSRAQNHFQKELTRLTHLIHSSVHDSARGCASAARLAIIDEGSTEGLVLGGSERESRGRLAVIVGELEGQLRGLELVHSEKIVDLCCQLEAKDKELGLQAERHDKSSREAEERFTAHLDKMSSHSQETREELGDKLKVLGEELAAITKLKTSLGGRVRQLERQLSDCRHENDLAMTSMKQRMVELRTGHAEEIERMGQARICVPTVHQLTQVNMGDPGLERVKEKYGAALRLARDEIHQSASAASQRALELITRESALIRRHTAHQMRKHCLSSYKRASKQSGGDIGESFARLEFLELLLGEAESYCTIVDKSPAINRSDRLTNTSSASSTEPSPRITLSTGRGSSPRLTATETTSRPASTLEEGRGRRPASPAVNVSDTVVVNGSHNPHGGSPAENDSSVAVGGDLSGRSQGSGGSSVSRKSQPSRRRGSDSSTSSSDRPMRESVVKSTGSSSRAVDTNRRPQHQSSYTPPTRETTGSCHGVSSHPAKPTFSEYVTQDSEEYLAGLRRYRTASATATTASALPVTTPIQTSATSLHNSGTTFVTSGSLSGEVSATQTRATTSMSSHRARSRSYDRAPVLSTASMGRSSSSASLAKESSANLAASKYRHGLPNTNPGVNPGVSPTSSENKENRSFLDTSRGVGGLSTANPTLPGSSAAGDKSRSAAHRLSAAAVSVSSASSRAAVPLNSADGRATHNYSSAAAAGRLPRTTAADLSAVYKRYSMGS